MLSWTSLDAQASTNDRLGNLSIDCGGLTGSDHPVNKLAVSNDTTAASDRLVGSDGTTRSDPTISADSTPADQSPEGRSHATEESLRVGNVCNTGDKHPVFEVTTTDDGRGYEDTETEESDSHVEDEELTTESGREYVSAVISPITLLK